MLQSLRDKMQGWPAIVVLGIAVFAMSFFGIEGYFSSQSETFVAKVGKREISQQQYQDTMNRIRQQQRAQMGDQFDPSVFDKPEFKQQVLDELIGQQLILQANEDLGMRVSDQSLRDTIAANPAFQVDGQFNADMYRAQLAAAGMTPDMFQSNIRTSLESGLLPDAISGSTIVTQTDIDRYLDIKLQRRDIRYFVLPHEAPADSQVTDAQVQDYYTAHQADFMNPEQVSLKYIEVNGADLKPESQPSDDDLKKRYQDEIARFGLPEQREVSHILINVPKNATPAQQKVALDKAEKIAAEATPENFAKLAQQDSDDVGSRLTGGDLGWLQKGVTNPAFESAMFALQKGQISKPVLSDEGYHIIYLRDVRSGQTKPFEQVRDQLLKEATSADHDRAYNDAAGKMTDLTSQNPGSLEPAAQALQLQIKETPLFGHSGGEGIAANPKVIAAAFSSDVLNSGNNSSLVDLSKTDSVVVRLDKHVPASPKPVAEVHDAIVQKILDQRIADAAKQKAEVLAQRLNKGEDMATLAKAEHADVQTITQAQRVQQGAPQPILDQAFVTPHPADGKSQYADVSMGNGAYAVLAVDKVEGGDLSKLTEDDRRQLYRQMMQAYGGVETQGFIDMLKAKSKIQIAKDRM
ncbi:SurA N-terminal domain-containing protein [Dyella caseinilytica]|uniref:Periplasmic chaperone PpiD n=1 Tax=Dyella caseinilytica TaxID=1849581 RepID=A0ABX7GXI2_9GAMM|nr:SurA N-terminal domain-containing protein [Dyella caseinilytica]QRN55127.1 SurA N-terminal domain-containing protein [Dyella caseinilytica]GFZ99543.1 peptidylprolyl isomerase [Dyella caseinilytica]